MDRMDRMDGARLRGPVVSDQLSVISEEGCALAKLATGKLAPAEFKKKVARQIN